MKRALLLSAFAFGCATLPPPVSLTQARAAADNPATKSAAELAPQAYASAQSFRSAAAAAYEDGDLASAEILGEHAIAAYSRTVAQARTVRAERRLAESRTELGASETALIELDALQARAERARADARQQADQGAKRYRVRRFSPCRPIEPGETGRVQRRRAGQQFAARDIERRPVLAQAACRAGEARRRHSLAAQPLERRRQARARVSRVAVGGIVDPGLGFTAQQRFQAPFGNREKRANETNASAVRHTQILHQRHGGQALAAAAGAKPEQ